MKEEAGGKIEEKKARFKKVASLRMTNALDAIRKLQNLNNPNYYLWEDTQIKKMEKALKSAVYDFGLAFRKNGKPFNF